MASDFPCDPAFEICEKGTKTIYEDIAADMAADKQTYTAMYEPGLEIEQYSLLWGAASAGMLLLSAYYYFEYNYSIWTDNKYPYRYQNVDDYDKDWALATKELSAWSKGIWAINLLHGAGMIAWALNMLFDNQGGVIHYIFYRMVQLSFITPVVDIAMALNIQRAYVQSATEEAADLALQSVSKHSVQYFYRAFNEDTRFGSGNGNYYLSPQFTNKYVLGLAAVIFS